MKYIFYVLPILFLCTGCIGPKVDSCLTDLNIVDTAVNALGDTSKATGILITPDVVIKTIHETEFVFCVPPADANKPEFYRTLKTGEHTYDSLNWDILLKWIEDNKK